MNAMKARAEADAAKPQTDDTSERMRERLAAAVSALYRCADLIEEMDESLARSRRKREEAEAELRSVKSGALDRMELEHGLDGGALIEAIRLVRYHLGVAGADSLLPTVGMAKWAADRIKGT